MNREAEEQEEAPEEGEGYSSGEDIDYSDRADPNEIPPETYGVEMEDEADTEDLNLEESKVEDVPIVT
jgi:hypothetical protein